MNPGIPFILIGLAVPLGVVGWRLYRDRRHRQFLEGYCQLHGYRFNPERPGAEEALARTFEVFSKGRRHQWANTISGQVGDRPFTAFDYTYIVGGGKNRQSVHLAMMLWEAPGASLPRFSLGPEGLFRRLAHRLGAQDIDFEGDDEFSRGYELQGDDEPAVRALFTAARRAYLISPGPDGKAASRHHLAGTGTQLLWWRQGRLPEGDALDQFIAEGDGLRRLFVDDR